MYPNNEYVRVNLKLCVVSALLSTLTTQQLNIDIENRDRSRYASTGKIFLKVKTVQFSIPVRFRLETKFWLESESFMDK